MREVMKPALVLFIVTVIAAACLGAVYGITKEPIERQQLLTRNNALRELLPRAADFNENEPAAGSGVKSCFTGVAVDTVVGYVVGVSPTGYGGAIEMMVALDPEGTIAGVTITSHSETPGLGANAKNPEFLGQFAGRRGPLVVTKMEATGENEIEAITSATITSRAVVDGVNTACEYFEKDLQGGGN